MPVTTPSRMSGSISLSRDGRHLMYVSSDERSTIAQVRPRPRHAAGCASPRARCSRARGSSTPRTSLRAASGSCSARWGCARTSSWCARTAPGTARSPTTPSATAARSGRRTARASASTATAAGATRRGRSMPDGSKARACRRRPPAPRGGTREWSPDGKRLATTDGVQTWIEDLTKPLAERKAEPLPPLEVKRALLPRSWSPDGSTLAGDLDFYVSPNSVTLLYSFASRPVPRAARGPGHAGVARRQPPPARGPARPDRARRHADRPREPGARRAPRRASASRATTAG